MNFDLHITTHTKISSEDGYTNGPEGSFWGDGNILKLKIMVMFEQHDKFTKKSLTCTLEMGELHI